MRLRFLMYGFLIGLTLAGLSVSGHAAQQSTPIDKGTIKKCQDATGKWHYGDTAAAACRESKITEINKRGVETKEVAAPLTEEQIKAKEIEQAEQEKLARLAAEQARKDKLLVNSYANEGELIAMRDRKLAEIDALILGSQETLTAQQAALERLQAKAKEESQSGKPVTVQTQKSLDKTLAVIAKQEAFMHNKRQERVAIAQQYQADLERFRQIKTRPADK